MTAFKIKLAGVSSTFRLINSKPVDSTATKSDTKSPKVDDKVDDEIPF